MTAATASLELATRSNGDAVASIMERVITAGDLKNLSAVERVTYYRAVCESVGLNPLTKPFDYITLNSKLTLYANKGCTDQLRKIHNVNIEIVSREQVGDLYVVTARAREPGGRSDEEIGAVNVANLKGEFLANAMMKASTKAKRRVTLSFCGLGLLDESEIESIPSDRRQSFREAEERIINEESGEDMGNLMDSNDLRNEIVRRCKLRQVEADDVGAGLMAVEKAMGKPLDQWEPAERRGLLNGIEKGKADKWKGMAAKIGQPQKPEAAAPIGRVEVDDDITVTRTEAVEQGDEGQRPPLDRDAEIDDWLSRDWADVKEAIWAAHSTAFPVENYPKATRQAFDLALGGCVVKVGLKGKEGNIPLKVRRSWYDAAVKGEGRFGYATAKA